MKRIPKRPGYVMGKGKPVKSIKKPAVKAKETSNAQD